MRQAQRREAVFNFEIDQSNRELELEVSNIKKVAIKFYIIDAEVLFSRTPFLKSNNSEFSYVKPCHVIEKQFEVSEEGDQKTLKQRIAVPEHLKLMNMVIEVNADGKQLFQSYYASQLKVHLTEAYGELKVTDLVSDKPLSSVYVKVFAREANGKVSFFKDGYTDIRGKFDYVQTSGNRLASVNRFAILILSDTLGSIIKECDPPKDSKSSGSSSKSSISTQDTSSNFLTESKAERVINRISAWKQKKK